jgi:hypothetical protein
MISDPSSFLRQMLPHISLALEQRCLFYYGIPAITDNAHHDLMLLGSEFPPARQRNGLVGRRTNTSTLPTKTTAIIVHRRATPGTRDRHIVPMHWLAAVTASRYRDFSVASSCIAGFTVAAATINTIQHRDEINRRI